MSSLKLASIHMSGNHTLSVQFNQCERTPVQYWKRCMNMHNLQVMSE